MIFHYDIEQKTDEWHEIKFGKIGGTRAGVGSDTLINTLLSEHLEDFEPFDEGFLSSAVQRGNDLEPIARNLLFTETFVDFKECGWIQSEENELLGISPDGISEDETIMCEIKCPQSKKYIDQLLLNDILPEYVDQLVHAFLVNDKLKTHYFAMYRPENKIQPIWYKALIKESEVNVGTAKKPVYKTIGEQVEVKRKEAKEVLESLKIKIEELKNGITK